MEGFRRAFREHGAVPEDGGGGLTGLPERTDVRGSNLLSGFVRVLDALDRVLVSACALATIAAGLVLTYSIAVRYVLHSSTDWQDEMAVFLLVGATFLSASYVQSMRGHIAIEAIEGFLPESIERMREIVSDIICFLFCAFFTWQSWLLLLEAIDDGRVTDSAWAPPLWIPYSLMTAGMSLLTLRLVMQLGQAFGGKRRARA
jgi:TRAP-type C4-dicarboxylate transport system permease small subunit